MRLIKDVILELNQSTEKEIVRKLESAGIKGMPRKSQYCPINKYISQETGIPKENLSTGVRWLNHFFNDNFDSKSESYRLGDSVRDFIHHFDVRYYPQLISEDY